MRAWQSDAEFLDIGTPADYLASSLVIGAREGVAVDIGARCHIAPTAHLHQTVLWDDVVVEAGAMLKECVVTDGVRVPADTSWHGVTLRVASGPHESGEKQIGDLAVGRL